jgi:flagellar FliJ protein
MGFQYPFQKVVDLKQNEKSQAEWFLSKAHQRFQSENNRLINLEEEKERITHLLLGAQQQGASISHLIDLETYLNHLNEQIHGQTHEVKQADNELTEQKNVVIAKTMQEKVWLKAREKAKHNYSQEQLQKEQLQLDEIAGNRYIYPSG